MNKEKISQATRFLLILLILAGCNMPVTSGSQNNAEIDMIRTQAAQTIEATFTQGALEGLFSQPTATTGTGEIAPSATQAIIPTETPTATATNTPLPTETPLPSATSTPLVPIIHSTVNTNCRSGPSKDYEVIGYLNVGDRVEVHGKLSDGSWWYIQNPDNLSKHCWVWNQTTVVDGNLSLIPVITPAPTPTPDTVVITVSSSAAPVSYTGACPVNIVLNGKITTNLPETVTYRWASSFPYAFVAKDIVFASAGSQNVTETMVIAATTAGYVRFRVYSPYEVKADKINLVINCVP